jgi:hypothetical protein
MASKKTFRVRDKQTRNIVALIVSLPHQQGIELSLFQLGSRTLTRHLVESLPSDLAKWYEVTVRKLEQTA